MACQIGIYGDRTNGVDQWDALIQLEDGRSPRDVLREITPFLREFHTQQDMHDTECLASWLNWFLIDASMTSPHTLARIATSREIRPDSDYFYKISPGLIEVYSIDEVLEWRLIAAVEIDLEPIEVETL